MKRTILTAAAAGLLATAPYAAAWQNPAPAPKPAERTAIVMAGSRSFLGVGVVEITSERMKALKLSEERGVEVTKVEESTPAEKAGLKVGDVVTEYNGQRVEGTEQFIRFVRETPAGRTVKLTVIRNGSSQVLAATIEARKARVLESGDWQINMPAMPNLPQMLEIPRPIMGWRTGALGIEAEAVSAQLAGFFGVKEGVLVRAVNKDSAAEKAGIKAGDVITKVDDKTVASPSDVTRVINQSKDKSLAVVVMRDRKEMSVNVKIEETRTPRGRAARLEQQRF